MKAEKDEADLHVVAERIVAKIDRVVTSDLRTQDVAKLIFHYDPSAIRQPFAQFDEIFFVSGRAFDAAMIDRRNVQMTTGVPKSFSRDRTKENIR